MWNEILKTRLQWYVVAAYYYYSYGIYVFKKCCQFCYSVLKAVDKRLAENNNDTTSSAATTTTSTITDSDRLSERVKSEGVSQKRNQSASPAELASK